MTNRKAFTLILIVVITISFGSYINPIINVSGNTVAAPVLHDIDPAGFSFDNGTIITVNYTVPRFAGIDGVLLVGEGSNLTMNLDNALSLNFSHSHRDLSYYAGSFNLTSNTKFKAYAWSGNRTNGTFEVLPVVNHLGPWHYLYSRNNVHPPYLDVDYLLNLHQLDSTTFEAEGNTTVAVRYIVRNGLPSDKVTLALSVYRDRINNGSSTNFDGITFLDMNYLMNDTGTGFPVFTVSFNVTERTLYFAANNSAGWDMNTNTGELKIYKIQTGFSFESHPETNDYYTNIDSVNIIVQTLNESSHDSFGITYRVEESSTNHSLVVNETNLTNGVLINDTVVTNSNGWNDTVREYKFTLGTFDIGNMVYYEAFNIYFNERYNETDGTFHKLKIYDAKPSLSLSPSNNSYFNSSEVTFTFSANVIKGSITNLTIDFGDGNSVNLTDFANNNVTHTYANKSMIYHVTLYANTSLLTVNNVTHTIFIDLTLPSGFIDSRTTNTTITKNTDGHVELYFNCTDNFGVFKVLIYWGDGTVWNATGESHVEHTYIKSGDYDVVVEIFDKAGNTFNLTLTFSIELEISNNTSSTPYNFVFVTFAIISLVLFYNKFKNKKLSKS